MNHYRSSVRVDFLAGCVQTFVGGSAIYDDAALAIDADIDLHHSIFFPIPNVLLHFSLDSELNFCRLATHFSEQHSIEMGYPSRRLLCRHAKWSTRGRPHQMKGLSVWPTK
jgi:hypothetical protein